MPSIQKKSASSRKKKILLFFIKALISLAFVFYVVFEVNWQEVLSDARRIEWWQTILYVVVLVLGMVISAYKWKFLARYKGFKLPLFDYFKFYLTGTFINNFTPSFIGGDAYKSYEIGRESGRYAEAASTVMFDRITGLIGAMILSLFFAAVNFHDVIKSVPLLTINILIILSLLSDVVLSRIRRNEFLSSFFKRILPEKIVCFIHELYTYSDNRKIIKRAIVWSAVFNFVGVGMVNYILFFSLGIKINPIDYLSVIFLTSIVSSIPISINNIGIKEWSYIVFFGVFGVASSAVVTVAIISRVLQMIVSFCALPFYLKGKYNFKNIPLISK